jgi:2-oxoacid:acceptor oxidoreductase delta subunit (pyruvate/2-ketoisovalerate family)
MYATAVIEHEKCTGCRLCILYCPDPNVLTLTNNKKVTVNGNRCKGCGLCVAACPKKAVAVKAV